MARRWGAAATAAALMITAGVVAMPVATVGQATPAPAASSAASPAATAPSITAIIVSTTNLPRGVPGSDGLVHLDYDLIVTNAFAGAVTLSEVAVVAPDGAELHRLAGDDLVAATQPLLGFAPTASIPVSGTVAVVMDVSVAADRVPSALGHRITYALAPDSPASYLIGNDTVDGPVLPIDPTAPVPISPPLRGPGWYALNDCCHADSIHRYVRLVVDGLRYVKSEMFAVDWVRLENGQINSGDGSTNEEFFGYGAELVAVAPGTVVRARDGQPENQGNNKTLTFETAIDLAGNFVVLEIGDGIYATYEHLQPGSLQVREGDRVEAGQSIGLLGNSGNSTAPHLHFGLIDGPDPSTANALPFVFASYTLVGIVTPDAATESFTVEGSPTPQTNTQPLDLTLIDLPE